MKRQTLAEKIGIGVAGIWTTNLNSFASLLYQKKFINSLRMMITFTLK
jgi:hypothetical protein